MDFKIEIEPLTKTVQGSRDKTKPYIQFRIKKIYYSKGFFLEKGWSGLGQEDIFL